MGSTIKLIIFVAVLFISFTYYGYNNYNNGNSDIALYGNVDIRDVVLGFRVGGRINNLNVDEGDQVKKDDVLAVLDKEPLEKEAALYRAQLSEANANFAGTNKEYLRQQDLFSKKVTSQREFDAVQENLHEAVARQEAAQALLDQSLLRIKDAELIAPEDGMIITRIRERGSIVSPGAPVYSLSLEKPVWIRTYIDEPKLGHIYPGQKVIINTDSGNQYEGKIGFISPQAEFTPKTVQTTEIRTSLVYRLRIIVQNPDTGLRQGMPVTIKIIKDAK